MITMNTVIQEVKVVQLSGSLDSTQSQEFKQSISEIVNREDYVKVLLIDLRNLTFMDSSGLGALVLAFKALRSAGKRMVICSINEQVRILFELTGMDKVFEIFPSQEEFNKVSISKN